MMVIRREVGEGIRLEVPGHGEVFVVVGKIVDGAIVHLEIEAATTVPIYRGEVWAALGEPIDNSEMEGA